MNKKNPNKCIYKSNETEFEINGNTKNQTNKKNECTSIRENNIINKDNNMKNQNNNGILNKYIVNKDITDE